MKFFKGIHGKRKKKSSQKINTFNKIGYNITAKF